MGMGAFAEDWRILLVEDEPITAEITVEALRTCGLPHVTHVGNGAEALDRIRAHRPPFDLIITDLNMPLMDGAEFLRHLADINRQIPIILLSGSERALLASAELLGRARHLNIIGALGKPVKCFELRDLLTRGPQAGAEGLGVSGSAPITESELRWAIENGQFGLYYQPKVSVVGREVISVEGLARWHHPDRGLMPPSDFIALAEQSGLISALTERLCQRAMVDLNAWRKAGLTFSVALNFSIETLTDLSLPKRLSALAADHGIAPADLILEVTESKITTNLADCLEVLPRLRMLGFG